MVLPCCESTLQKYYKSREVVTGIFRMDQSSSTVEIYQRKFFQYTLEKFFRKLPKNRLNIISIKFSLNLN